MQSQATMFCVLLTSHTSFAASRLLVQRLEHKKHICMSAIRKGWAPLATRKQNFETASDKVPFHLHAPLKSAALKQYHVNENNDMNSPGTGQKEILKDIMKSSNGMGSFIPPSSAQS